MSNNDTENKNNIPNENELIDEVVMEELKALKGKGKDEELSPEEIDEILEDLDKAEVWLLDGACNKGKENETNERDK